MLRHIVFFSAKDPADVETIERALSGLAAIPAARRLEVSRNIRKDQLSGEVDVVVYGEFEDEEALAAFKAHPIYAETTGIVRPLRELRLVADVVATGS